MKVLITRKLPRVAIDLLLKNNIAVQVHDSDEPIKFRELVRYGKDADGILSLLTDRIDEKIINRLEKCKVIANYAVGYNNINTKAAKAKNIIVTNTPDILTDATADLTLALLLSVCRRVIESEMFTRSNKFTGWQPELFLGIELKGKTLGVVGAGRIGRAVAKRAAAFGMNIIYFNKSKKTEFELELNAQKVSLTKLIKKSDFVSLHLPLNSETQNLINSEKLELLKPNAVIINTARGEIIDENYLIAMLKKKRIFGAGFDVYQNEPKVNKQLLKLNNVVLLPHIGSATFEARSAMAELAVKNIINVLKGLPPITPVEL